MGNNSDITMRNAIIESVDIAITEQGYASPFVLLNYGDTSQIICDYCVSLDPHFLERMLDVAGVVKWSELIGKAVRVLCSHQQVHAVGHIVNQEWCALTEEGRRLTQ